MTYENQCQDGLLLNLCRFSLFKYLVDRMLEIMSNDDFEPEEGNCLRFIVGTSDTYVAKIYFLWMFDCCKSKEDFMSIPHI